MPSGAHQNPTIEACPPQTADLEIRGQQRLERPYRPPARSGKPRSARQVQRTVEWKEEYTKKWKPLTFITITYRNR